MSKDAIPAFSKVINQLDAGAVDALLTSELAALVEAVTQHDKPGALTIKIAVEPQGLQGRNVSVTVDHVVRLPRQRPGGSVLYVGDSGSLHRTDPYQQTLPTREDTPT